MRYLLIAGLFISTPAFAAPTYLECSIDGGEGKPPVAINLVADEANGMITQHVVSMGSSKRVPAVFSQTAVQWVPTSGLSYSLSRTDLSIVRVLTIGAKSWTDRGSCQVQKPVNRAF
jgi:hypothetical protein